ncbi:MAG: hypothetical protein EOO15_23145 [Chitinophagaceae bacterium]|nr:MAG: hypothetical protein EOO15_23145 [Chitinophagaceae bacterium]
MSPLHDLNLHIRQEADSLLYGKGLLNLLKGFGTPHVHGSYALDLMTWRDLDIYLRVDRISTSDFFQLGERICRSFSPVKMSYRNEVEAQTKGLPTGLYWGVYLGNERAGAWKIDIWAIGPEECDRLLQQEAELKQQLTPEAVQRILEIKSQCWTDAAYRKSYSSADIYTAVLGHGIASHEAFCEYLKKRTLPG